MAWMPRIGAPSGVFRIQATPGSGKTQLALQLLGEAATDGLHASYMCYNRTLADHVRRLASPKVQVVNYHELCVEHYRREHGEPEFTSKGFKVMADAYLAASADFMATLELLVIDEGQDFDAGWVESLCNRLKPGGRLYVLEDDAQRLYQQEGFELGEAVTVDCSDNFRSPRTISDVINALGLVRPAVRSLNPYQGEMPGIRTYGSDGEQRHLRFPACRTSQRACRHRWPPSQYHPGLAMLETLSAESVLTSLGTRTSRQVKAGLALDAGQP